ncbi:MAG: prolipoprotein diacylglyceryl transferase family protein [Thermoguttaceae bacterium]|jgi:uncharacterized radical SAM superfamily Fe-S cluster-containing enzyme/prolipoprotein diacylglyceryltransferase
MDWTYRAIMLAAILAGWALFRRQPRPPEVRTSEIAAIALGAFCGGMIGARLPFVLADWQGFLSGRAWFADGKTILSGLVGGYLGAELTEWAIGMRGKMCDAFAVPLAVGMSIGRLGCFHAGCCHGVPTSLPWGVDFGDGLPRHPTQLYESAFHLAAAIVLWRLQQQGKFQGQLVRIYLVAYFIYRFGTEFIRPEAKLWLGLTGYQLAALVLVPFFALWCCPGYRPAWLARRHVRPRALPRDTGDGVIAATETLCPRCLQTLPGTIVQRDGRIYMQRTCPEHGPSEALLSSSRRHYYLRHEAPHPASTAGLHKGDSPIFLRSPAITERESGQSPGCCGPAPGHRTCVALLEITGACNLRCPVCFAGSPAGGHRAVAEIRADLESFLAQRGPLDVLQLSGGEPLLHPDLLAIIDMCRRLPIDQIAVNTNGLRLAANDRLAAELAARRPRLQLSLQLDGLDARVHRALRGADLAAQKQAVLETIARHDLPTNLTCTVVKNVNESQLGPLLALALAMPQVRGITYQPATWSGRFEQTIDPLDRTTAADVIGLLARQSDGLLGEDDFFPLPCSNPNCCSITFLSRKLGKGTVPSSCDRKRSPNENRDSPRLAGSLALTRLVNYEDHLERLADRVNFKLDDARACCGFGGRPADFLRVAVKPFMDAYTYDAERSAECCVHVIRPGGRAVSFCRFNALQRRTVSCREEELMPHV